MVAQVFATPNSADTFTSEEIEYLREVEDPIRLASALTKVRYGRKLNTREIREELTPTLQSILYHRNGWQEGRLAKNLAALAVEASNLGKRVSIATTNYDDYLERALDDQLQLLRSIASTDNAPDPELPRLRVRQAGSTTFLRGAKVPTLAPAIDLVYLHGRVPKSGRANGRIVLNELDYAETRTQTYKELMTLLKTPRSAFVCFGASLTDPPLVDALADTRAQPAKRFAVVPVESLGYTEHRASDARRLTQLVKGRGELLNTEIVTPDFKSQIAQLCSEIQYELTAVDHTGCVQAGRQSAYGDRLTTWWRHWKAKSTTDGADDAFFAAMRDGKESIMDLIAPPATTLTEDNEHEQFRLELWVRQAPSTSSRRLTLWATSVGPIIDRSRLRESDILLRSRNASIFAFTEGRPVHVDGTLFTGSGPTDRRWNSYLSVPIYATVNFKQIPVGVVTLASSCRASASRLPLPEAEDMKDLIDHMHSKIGLELLKVEGDATVGPDNEST